MSNQSIRQYLTNFEEGKYDNPNRETQIKAGWYDWFCTEKELAGRLRSMIPFIKERMELRVGRLIHPT